MNNKGLVEFAKMALAEKWGYVWGTFGQRLTAETLAQKCRQYPAEVGGKVEFISKNWMFRRVVDCVGLIKGYYWTIDGTVQYDSNTDVSADGMYLRAKEKGSMDTLPDIPGICLWKRGHIGVYIGGGQVIEARGTMYGVILSPLTGPESAGWTNWLKCSYIDYIVDTPAPQPVPNVGDKEVEAIQLLCNAVGARDMNNMPLEVDGIVGPCTISAVSKLPVIGNGDRGAVVRGVQGIVGTSTDGDFGPMTLAAVKAWQAAHGLEADGIVGPKTWAKMAKIN